MPAALPLTYSSNVSGSLGLTKNNAGTLTLTGTSSYTGDTTVNSGTLSAASITNSGTASAVGDALCALVALDARALVASAGEVRDVAVATLLSEGLAANELVVE